MISYLASYPGVFGTEEVRILTAALDDAWKTVQESGATYAVGDLAESARAALAQHIIEAAIQGERDHRRLVVGALMNLAVTHEE